VWFVVWRLDEAGEPSTDHFGARPGAGRQRAAAEGAFLQAPWMALLAAVRSHDAAATSAEFDALFQGVGKPEGLLYGSHHLGLFQ